VKRGGLTRAMPPASPGRFNEEPPAGVLVPVVERERTHGEPPLGELAPEVPVVLHGLAGRRDHPRSPHVLGERVALRDVALLVVAVEGDLQAPAVEAAASRSCSVARMGYTVDVLITRRHGWPRPPRLAPGWSPK
jgi:hypothetical protein